MDHGKFPTIQYIVTAQLPSLKCTNSHFIAVVVGFVDTLVEVNEDDEQATLNVSITFPAPGQSPGFEIVFSLNLASIEITAGEVTYIPQCCESFVISSVLFHENSPMLSLTQLN